MIKPVSNCDVRSKRTNKIRKQNAEDLVNMASPKQTACINHAQVYSNNCLAMQNMNESKNVSFKGENEKKIYLHSAAPYIDMNSLLRRGGIDPYFVNDAENGKYFREKGYYTTTSLPFNIALSCGLVPADDYKLKKYHELEEQWEKEMTDATKDTKSILEVLKKDGHIVTYYDIAYYLANNDRIDDVIDFVKENNDEYSVPVPIIYDFVEAGRIDKVLEMAESDKNCDILTSIIYDLVKAGRTDDVLDIKKNAPENNNPSIKTTIPEVYALVKADRIDEALSYSDRYDIVPDVMDACMTQGKYDKALEVRSENLEDITGLKSDGIYNEDLDIELIDYLLSQDRDEEALEVFGDQKDYIIIMYVLQHKEEKALDMFNTEEDLENYTPADKEYMDFEYLLKEADYYTKHGRGEEKHYGVPSNKDRFIDKMRNYLISQGRDEEADMRFPVEEKKNNSYHHPGYYDEKRFEKAKKEEDIRTIFETHSGYYYIPEKLKHASDENKKFAADFIENNADIADYEKQKKQEAVDKARGFLSWRYSLPERAAIDILTLGIAELVNINSREQDKEKRLQRVDEDVRSKKDTINASKTMLLDCRDSNIGSKQVKSSNMNSLEEQKEEVKKPLQSRYIAPLYALKYGTPAKLPNCIMLTGDTPDVMKKIIDWTGEQAENTNTNYVKLPSLPNKDEMKKNILDTLEQAEENYQNSGNRSLIFVNGMDKLLREDSNTQSEIASMKDIMSDTNEDFHSTIIFYTTNPDKLDEGTTASHRVGLKVNVPFDKFKIDEGE
ncbi:MAG: hypothetical protein LUH05_00595 [Candidatus Gastranaerophilales bacterium]|nr:hypothetical protein [Candidatus Gastranaerophilales bacterium]